MKGGVTLSREELPPTGQRMPCTCTPHDPNPRKAHLSTWLPPSRVPESWEPSAHGRQALSNYSLCLLMSLNSIHCPPAQTEAKREALWPACSWHLLGTSSPKLHSPGGPSLRVPSLGLRPGLPQGGGPRGFQSHSPQGGKEPSDRPGLPWWGGSSGRASGPEHRITLCLCPSEATPNVLEQKPLMRPHRGGPGPTRNGQSSATGTQEGSGVSPGAPGDLGTSPRPPPPWRRESGSEQGGDHSIASLRT